MEDSFIDLLVENLKFEKVFEKTIIDMVNSKDYNMIKLADKNKRQLSWFQKRNREIMKSNGIEVPEIEGTKYREGLAVDIINKDELKDNDNLKIIQVLEPIIMKNGNVLRTGKIIVGGDDINE